MKKIGFFFRGTVVKTLNLKTNPPGHSELESNRVSTRQGQASRSGGGLIIVGVFIIAGGGSLKGYPLKIFCVFVCKGLNKDT